MRGQYCCATQLTPALPHRLLPFAVTLGRREAAARAQRYLERNRRSSAADRSRVGAWLRESRRRNTFSRSSNSMRCMPLALSPTSPSWPGVSTSGSGAQRHSCPLHGTRRPRRAQTLTLLKSISGCAFLNFSSVSILRISSDVGLPVCRCWLSNIIFSTMARVSPSRSLSFEFSGWILVVSSLGSCVRTCGHHRWLPMCALIFSSSKVRVPSSGGSAGAQHSDPFSGCLPRPLPLVVVRLRGTLPPRLHPDAPIVHELSSLAMSSNSSPSSSVAPPLTATWGQPPPWI